MDQQQQQKPSSSDVAKHYAVNKRYASVGDSEIWVEVIALAKKYSKLNLGHVCVTTTCYILLRV